MKLMREEWPATRWMKVDVVAQWAFGGILLGCVSYVVLWQFREPAGQPPGGALALVNLITSPWAWAFVALCSLSMGLIPVMAMCRGTETTYCRSLYSLVRVWVGGLLMTGTIAVLVYHVTFRVHRLDWSVVDLFTLSIPTILALVIVMVGCCRVRR